MTKNITTNRERINTHNNDYSLEENLFMNSTGLKLVSKEDYQTLRDNKSELPTLSIIIPYYNDQQSISHTLRSINKQKNINFDKIEVIIVDDGSILEVPKISHLKYKLRIIPLIKNMGLVRVRNIGMLLAQNQILMYLDSDIILHENVIFNHLFAHHGTGNKNLIFVGFREWIDSSDPRVSMKNITNNMIDLESDFRVKVTFDERHIPYIPDQKLLGKTHYVARDTNYYKDFSNGYIYLHYTLSSQVHGFLFSIPLCSAIEAGPVGETEKGWGADDALLATHFIANGSKVIPLINSKGLHLYSMNGTRDESTRQKERKVNKKRLQDLLDEPYVKYFRQYDEE